MADRFIPEHRRTNFKAKGQFKPEELRRRREEQQVEIRKQKREENLAKRRNLQIGSPTPHSGLAGADSDDEGTNTESQVSHFWLFFLPPGLSMFQICVVKLFGCIILFFCKMV